MRDENEEEGNVKPLYIKRYSHRLSFSEVLYEVDKIMKNVPEWRPYLTPKSEFRHNGFGKKHKR